MRQRKIPNDEQAITPDHCSEVLLHIDTYGNVFNFQYRMNKREGLKLCLEIRFK